MLVALSVFTALSGGAGVGPAPEAPPTDTATAAPPSDTNPGAPDPAAGESAGPSAPATGGGDLSKGAPATGDGEGGPAPTTTTGEADPSSTSDPEADAAADAAADPGAKPDGDPDANLNDPFEGMLEGQDSDEPRRTAAPRRTSGDPREQGIGREEALRRYYAALYRPASNPARPYFGVLAGGALIGGNDTEINGRLGTLDVEGGASWNQVSFAVGAGLWGGGLQLENENDVTAPVGVSAQANLGLGRLAYVRRGVLDLRLGYRLTYMPVRGQNAERPDLDVSAFMPHGPELRLDAGFMVSRVREPRFFHRLGVSLAVHLIVGSGPVSAPLMTSPRLGIVYAFG